MMIERKSLAERVAEMLQRRIADGTYKTGDKLPTEPELMKMFGVGRSSIREAVKLLVNAGAVRVRQGAGTFVAERSADGCAGVRLDAADRTELDEVRKILDVAIAERAVARRSERDLVRMRSFIDKRKECADSGALEECIEADLNFHIAVADAAGNRILADIYRSACLHLLSEFDRMYKDTSCFASSQASHEKLLKYIAAGDLKGARKAATVIVDEP